MHTLAHPATPSTGSRTETHPDTQSQPAQEGRITTRQGGIKLGGPYCRRPSMPIRAHGPTQARKRAAREHVQPTLLKLQSTSPKSPLFWHYSPRWSALWARLRSQRVAVGVSGSQCGWRADVSLWCASRGSARARAGPHVVFFQKSQVIWVSSLLLGIEKTAEFQRCGFKS